MKNFVFVLLILFNFYFLVKCSQIDSFKLNYFVYFVKDKNMIVCSEKEENLKFLFTNITDNKSSCSIDLKRNGVYYINLHMKELNVNPRLNFYEDLNGSIDANYLNLIDIKIGNNIVLSHVEYDPHYTSSQEFLLKLEDGIFSYSNSQLCNDFTDIKKCDFLQLPHKYPTIIKLNFDFPSKVDHNLVLLEKQSKANSNSCNPPCVNGICYNSSCFCKNGYMGTYCSLCKII